MIKIELVVKQPIEQGVSQEKVKQEKVKIEFTSDEEYETYRKEYEACWIVCGQEIIEVFEQVTHLPFPQKQIKAKVYRGGRSHSGHTLEELMLLRCDSSDKLGSLIHELTHRFIMGYNLWRKNKEKLGLTEVHQLLDLIYFEVLAKLFGEKAAMERANHEINSSDPKYKDAWSWFLNKTPDERKKLLEEALKGIVPNQNDLPPNE